MNRFVKHIVVVILLFLTSFAIAQEGVFIHYNDTNTSFLRWGVHKTADAYNIYRKENNGDWVKLNQNPITYLLNNQSLVDEFGHNSQLLIGLLGKQNESDNLTINDFKTAWQNDKKFNFINAIALVNPKLGRALGVWFEDKNVKENATYQYKVTSIVNGAESDWIISKPKIKNGKEAVPYIDNLQAEGRNNSAYLYWDKNKAEFDAGNIVTFNVYKSDEELGEFLKTNIHGVFPMKLKFDGDPSPKNENIQDYLDEFLENDKPYYYYITAVNAFGFESQPSSTIEVIPGNYLEPLPPFNINIESVGKAAYITWNDDSESVKGYEIYRSKSLDKDFEKIFPASNGISFQQKSYLDYTIEIGQTYFYAIKTINTIGDASEFGVSEQFRLIDIIPPEPPTNITGKSETGQIQLNWNQPADNDIKGYRIERTGGYNQTNRLYQLFDAQLVTTNSFLDTDFSESNYGTYGYLIYSIDKSGNESIASDTFFIQLADSKAPPPPSIIRFNEDASKETFTIYWTESPADDIDKYNIYFSNDEVNEYKKIDETQSTEFIYNHKNEFGQYFFKVSAIDVYGNESEKSNAHSATLKKSPYPLTPKDGSIAYEDNVVVLKWNHAENNSDLKYHISKYANGGTSRANIGQVEYNTTTFEDPHVIKGDSYLYEIRAYNKDWKMSKPLTLKIKIK